MGPILADTAAARTRLARPPPTGAEEAASTTALTAAAKTTGINHMMNTP
jgi:hypothetical protein